MVAFITFFISNFIGTALLLSLPFWIFFTIYGKIRVYLHSRGYRAFTNAEYRELGFKWKDGKAISTRRPKVEAEVVSGDEEINLIYRNLNRHLQRVSNDLDRNIGGGDHRRRK